MNFYPTPWRLAAAVLALSASAASAQTLPTPAPTKVYNSATTPQLIGLDGVSVLGQLFNVRFIGGQSCAQTFNGCDSVDDFTFKTAGGAKAASQALKDALSPSDLPSLDGTQVGTPYSVSGTLANFPVQVWSYNVYETMEWVASGGDRSETYVLPAATSYTVWTPAVTAVPEPGTYALMFAGLGAVGFTARRRRSA